MKVIIIIHDLSTKGGNGRDQSEKGGVHNFGLKKAWFEVPTAAFLVHCEGPTRAPLRE